MKTVVQRRYFQGCSVTPAEQRTAHGGSLFHPSRICRSSFQPNLTSLTNQRNRNENLLKFGSQTGMGVPRISRQAVRPITVLHETPHLMVAGRNYANGFSSNQYLLIQKETKECIFVDASDDWPDDWAAFIASSGLTPTHVFVTHCHIDNVVNLNSLMAIMEQHFHTRLGLMWCPAEQCWVDAYPRACERYGRTAELGRPLPFLQNNLYTHFTYAHHLHQKQRMLEEQHRMDNNQETEEEQEEQSFRLGKAKPQQRDAATSSPPPQLIRTKDLLLSSATNRSTSFYEFGPHSVLHYMFTPGHSPGHMMLSLPRERLLFSGDVLHFSGIGRVDLPWGCGSRLAESLLMLEELPDSTVVLPGHGRLTTMGRERRENRAVRSLYERRELGVQEVSVGFNQGYL